MSGREDQEIGDESSAEGRAEDARLPRGAEAPGGAGSIGARALLPALVPAAARFRPESFEERAAGARFSSPRGLAWAAAVAAVAVVAGAAFLAFNEHRSEAGLLAEQANETQALAKTIDDLSQRLSTMESVKSHDDLIELRRSVGDIRASVSSSRDLSAALSQLAQRVERLDREESAKVDKLNERVDRGTSAETAELAARLDKLEKKVVASAAPPPPPPKQPAPPKFGPMVSTETTGSIEAPRPVLRGYIVLGARDGTAIVEGRFGERAVQPGDFLPGAGRVERIAREGRGWVVLTERGLIPTADEMY